MTPWVQSLYLHVIGYIQASSFNAVLPSGVASTNKSLGEKLARSKSQCQCWYYSVIFTGINSQCRLVVCEVYRP